MTKSTITRERIQRIMRAIDSEAYDDEEIREWLSSYEIMELARMALAAMDSEPVAWIVHARTGDQLTTDGGYVANAEGILGLHSTPLFRHAQPAPVVPDAATAIRACLSEFLESARDIVEECADIAENACRAVMLQPLHTIKAASALESLPKTGEVLHTNSPVIPDGYVMVPKEPTQAMCAAFNDSDYGRKSLRERYVSMLAAAPQEVKP
ncbi:TPA: hypothetical protein ACPY9W_003514 [Klebsiella aerogenes]